MKIVATAAFLSVLMSNAAFAQTVLTTGAKRQRCETRVAHPGGGASVRIDGLYLPTGARQADLTSEVAHKAADGTTTHRRRPRPRSPSGASRAVRGHAGTPWTPPLPECRFGEAAQLAGV